MTIPSWYNKYPGLWDREQDDMQYFRQLNWRKYVFPFLHWRWTGLLQPFNRESNIGLIARHLKQLQPLQVSPTGLLIPTRMDLDPLEVTAPAKLERQFLVDITYFDEETVPWFHSLRTRIDHRTYSRHPHKILGQQHPLHRYNQKYPDSGLCVLAPHYGAWRPGYHTAADAVEYLAMYLGTHMLWEASGRREWLIPGAPHDPYTTLLTTKAQDPCFCGKARSFASCHRGQVLVDVAAEANKLGFTWDPGNTSLSFA